MKKYKYTHRVTKIIHDDNLSYEQKCKKLEPLIESYIFSSYRTEMPYCNPDSPYYITGSYLNKQYKSKFIKYDIIEWGKVSEFNMPKYWKEKFKNYPDRQVLHVNMTFYSLYPKCPINILLKEKTEFDFYLSLKKFSKSMK